MSARMFEYVKVRSTFNGMDYGYLLKVASMEDLWNCMMCSNNVSDRLIDHVIKRAFCMTPSAFKEVCDNVLECNNPTNSALQFVSKPTALTDSWNSKKKCLEEFGCLYFNKNGGFFTKTEDIIEYGKPVFSSELKDIHDDGKSVIELFKYPAGEHYYARVDGKDMPTPKRNDMESHGWDTETEAVSAAIKECDLKDYQVERLYQEAERRHLEPER